MKYDIYIYLPRCRKKDFVCSANMFIALENSAKQEFHDDKQPEFYFLYSRLHFEPKDNVTYINWQLYKLYFNCTFVHSMKTLFLMISRYILNMKIKNLKNKKTAKHLKYFRDC